MEGEFWSDEMFETATRMRREGFSAAKIGAVIGRSRSAVLSKMRRRHIEAFGRTDQVSREDARERARVVKQDERFCRAMERVLG